MDDIYKKSQEKKQKTLESLENELNGLRTGRASVKLLDPIRVDVYRDRMPISQIGTIATSDAKTLSIQVWDKAVVKAVEKAIVDANLGLTPNTDGQLIRLNIPPLTEERRKEYVKLAHKYGENSKISIRNIRRDAMDAIRTLLKDSIISEDESAIASDKIQKITDEFINKIDKQISLKEKEIMAI